jgi:deazaflavin-dependent oxidoreductase (nitroreductase family)
MLQRPHRGSPSGLLQSLGMGNEQKRMEFKKPSVGEAFFNRVMGFLAGLGIGPSFIYLLQVKGRKTGKIFSTPVNLMEFGGKQVLVAPRGRTQWVRNAEAAGEVTLKRGSQRLRFDLRAIADEQKPQILKEYLDRYASAVRKFFPVAPGSPAELFRPLVGNYPVFELVAHTLPGC